MGLFSKAKAPSEPKPIGEVRHYYGGIGVAIVKFSRTVKVGERIRFKGATTDFEDTIVSMQYDHKDIREAKKGQEVGVKVSGNVREGDEAHEV